MPRVSVLITLYNKGDFVTEAVRSALASDFQDIEVLVVDDGSTDDGPEQVRAIGDPRIRLLPSPRNTGRPAAANRGFDAALGEYIAVLDADDAMRADRISRQVSFLDAHPEVGIVGSSLGIMNRDEEPWNWPATDEEARGLLLFGDPVCYGTSMIRKELITTHGLRCDEAWRRPGMDYLFLLAAGAHTRFSNIMEPLTSYRIGAQNMRHGRDPVEDRAATYRAAFAHFAIPATEGELDLQLLLHGFFRRNVDAPLVRALHDWILKLKVINKERGLFPAEVFERELERRWSKRFHQIADRSTAAAWTHMRASGSFPLDRLRYLAGAALRRWRGPHAALPRHERFH